MNVEVKNISSIHANWILDVSFRVKQLQGHFVVTNPPSHCQEEQSADWLEAPSKRSQNLIRGKVEESGWILNPRGRIRERQANQTEFSFPANALMANHRKTQGQLKDNSTTTNLIGPDPNLLDGYTVNVLSYPLWGNVITPTEQCEFIFCKSSSWGYVSVSKWWRPVVETNVRLLLLA